MKLYRPKTKNALKVHVLQVLAGAGRWMAAGVLIVYRGVQARFKARLLLQLEKPTGYEKNIKSALGVSERFVFFGWFLAECALVSLPNGVILTPARTSIQ